MSKPEVCINLIDDQFSIKLEVLRGMSDHFYYALRDENAARDELCAIKFYVDDDESKIMYK